MNHEHTINLDGKVDQKALAWRLRGHLECHLAERSVTTVIDWPDYIANGWINPVFVESHMHQIGVIPGGTSVVMTVDTDGLRCP
jgi:hypothetical protein